MQKTKIFLIAALLCLMTAAVVIAQETYVRKKVNPNFFIPAREMKKPVKILPAPQYTQGQEESIKTAKPEADVSASETITEPETNTQSLPPAESSGTPDYQQKYQQYLNDVGEVSKNHELPDNPALEKDLSKMDSDERILIDQKFNQTRNPEGDFQKALQQK